MADTVRYLLEAMVPELEDLEKRGYFSRSEVKQIAQRRQDFEYALKRKAALKTDFLRYIEYEAKLERLQQHRRKQRGIAGKKTLADYCISRRINFIYDRLLRKFRGDLALWARWLRYCTESGASRQVSKVVTQALQYHPIAPGLWTFAAAWEFEHNLNAASARSLMQQALRMCKHAEVLWHEYYRMELLYALRLRERRRTLGIENARADAGEGAEADEAELAVQSVLEGAVAGMVYKNAIVSIPASLPFRAKFLDILRPYEFPGKAGLEAAILESVSLDFGTMAQAWDLLARRHAAAGAWGQAAEVWPGVQQAIGMYQRGLECAPAAEVGTLLVAFLEEQLGYGLAALAALAEPDSQAATRLALARTCEALQQAMDVGSATEDVLAAQLLAHVHCGRTDKALAAAEAATQLLPSSSSLWLLRIKLAGCLVQSAASEAGPNGHQAVPSSVDDGDSSDDSGPSPSSSPLAAEQLQALVLEAATAVPAADAPAVWLAGLQAFCSLAGNPARLGSAFAHWLEGGTDISQVGISRAAAAIVEAVWTLVGPDAARNLYRPLLRILLTRGALAHAVLDAEVAALRAADPQALSVKQVQVLFEAAVECDGRHDMQLWSKFLAFDQFNGNAPGQVYWRAVKSLDAPDAFVELVQLQRQ